MVSSLLVMREVPPRTGQTSGVFVLLHGSGGDADELLPLAASVRPGFRSVAVEGPRTVVAYTVEKADTFRGYEWYPAADSVPLELARYGHALASLEQLVVDVLREYPGLPVYLLGRGQGGSMALALASVMPEYLAGLVSIGGALQSASSSSLEVRQLNGLPVLLIDGDGDGDLAATADALGRLGADVDRVAAANGTEPASAIRQWLHNREAMVGNDRLRS